MQDLSPLSRTLSAETDDQPRLNRRQAAKVRTRQKVLDAARGLFAERGYDAATIRDIARAAGMSTGAVFANFQDKAELFETVFAEDLAGLAADMAAAAAVEAPVVDRLAGALDAGYHRSLDQLPLMQAMIARSWFQPADADQRSRAHVRPVLDVLSGVLQAAMRDGQLRQDADLALLPRLIWDVYVSNFRFAAYDGWDKARLSDHARRQLEMILASQLAR